MPPVHHLNHPPHPFWDFVQEMNDHPMWGGRPGPAAAAHPHAEAQAQGLRSMAPESATNNEQSAQPQAQAQAQAQGQAQSQAQGQPEDPPEVDPATLHANAPTGPGGWGWGGRGGGRGRHGRHGRERPEGRGRHAGGHPGWPFGGPPFGMPGGFPDAHRAGFAPPPFAGEGPTGPQPHAHPHAHPHHPPHHHHHHHPHHGPRGRHGPPPPHAGFNLGNFLNELGDRIGIDLQGAAQGLGIDRFMPASTSPDVDFEPKFDIFDRPQDFTIHISLPGAKKEDVGVDWDGEHSLLRITGVVHRPEADEEMLKQLVVDGRKREVGVFEKAIRLGTKRDPASIDVAGIRAKMTDGVLVVRVPKVEKKHQKRDVPISGATPSPPRHASTSDVDNEVDMFDASQEEKNAGHAYEYNQEPQQHQTQGHGQVPSEWQQWPVLQPARSSTPTVIADSPRARSVTPTVVPSTPQPPKEAHPDAVEPAAAADAAVATSSSTSTSTNTDGKPVPNRVFPAHQPHRTTSSSSIPSPAAKADDWETFQSDDEGDYIKINVD